MLLTSNNIFVEFLKNVNLGQVIFTVGQVKLDTHLPEGQVCQNA